MSFNHAGKPRSVTPKADFKKRSVWGRRRHRPRL